MATTAVSRQAWDRLSTRYDRQLWLERSAIDAALDLLDLHREERLLDVATGTGAVLRRLARREQRPREVVGVDSSAAMLAKVPALADGWTVTEGDARALPFDDARFDAAIASYLLHVLADDDVPVVLAELRRVLRPGGRLVAVTPSIPARGAQRPLAFVLDALARRRGERFAGLHAYDPPAALQAAGFTLVRARRSLRGYASLCVLARAGG